MIDKLFHLLQNHEDLSYRLKCMEVDIHKRFADYRKSKSLRGMIVEQSEKKERAILLRDGPKTCRYSQHGEPYHK